MGGMGWESNQCYVIFHAELNCFCRLVRLMTIRDEQGLLAGITKFVELWDQALAHPVDESGVASPTVLSGHTPTHPPSGMIPEAGHTCLHMFGVLKTFNVIPCLKVAFAWEDECGVKCHPFGGYALDDGHQPEVVAL